MTKTFQVRGIAYIILLCLLVTSAQAQEATESPFSITLSNIELPATCSESGWRIDYHRTYPDGYYSPDPARYNVQRVNGDVVHVDYWGSGYSAYIQDYFVSNGQLRDYWFSSSYTVPLADDTYQAETIEFIYDGDRVIWETRATLTCDDGVVTAADIVSLPTDSTLAELPAPGENLVLALGDIPIYRNNVGTNGVLGTIHACQTFYLSDVRRPRASISILATESITGHTIYLYDTERAPLVDVDEDYGQPGGQPILDVCAEDTSS